MLPDVAEARPPMIADVAFDVPVDHAFAYRVPEGWRVVPGQRVRAPLRGAARPGVVVAVRSGGGESLKALAAIDDPVPWLGPEALDLAQWVAAESLSSLGSTLTALTPGIRPTASRRQPDPAAAAGHVAESSRPAAGRGAAIDLFVGVGRERRVLEHIGAGSGPVLVLLPDVDACARWTERLARIARTVRLDSGAPDPERAQGWRDLERGAVRLAVGTRSALLAPLPSDGTIVLVDEHDPAHRPPGALRVHAREVVLERARRQGLRALFTAATPSAEMWHQAVGGTVALRPGPATPWPAVAVADTRGILRREALTPTLVRDLREVLAGGRRAFLAVSRRASALACDECGAAVRCGDCGIPLAYARAAAALACRLCGVTRPLPEVCAECHGHRLSPFGWGAERVEHAVRRRFPKARVARFDPETSRGARAEASRAAAAAADVVIGTRGALRLFGPGTLGLAGFVSPDQLLRLPDFRAAEHTLAFLWAAAERVRPDGRLVIQSQNPAHYAFTALIAGDLTPFYERELAFRRELGYPPFRRLAVIAVRGRTGSESGDLAASVAAALAGAPDLVVYPPQAEARGRARHVVVKGPANLPAQLRLALAAWPPSSRARGIMTVEVDPVQWPS